MFFMHRVAFLLYNIITYQKKKKKRYVSMEKTGTFD